jgi:hypothetical protein
LQFIVLLFPNRALAVRSTPQKDKAEMEVSIGIPIYSGTLSSNDPLAAIAGTDVEMSAADDEVGPEYSNDMVYKRINLDDLEGKNFANKMELLMAVLADATN